MFYPARLLSLGVSRYLNFQIRISACNGFSEHQDFSISQRQLQYSVVTLGQAK